MAAVGLGSTLRTFDLVSVNHRQLIGGKSRPQCKQRAGLNDMNLPMVGKASVR